MRCFCGITCPVQNQAFVQPTYSAEVDGRNRSYTTFTYLVVLFMSWKRASLTERKSRGGKRNHTDVCTLAEPLLTPVPSPSSSIRRPAALHLSSMSCSTTGLPQLVAKYQTCRTSTHLNGTNSSATQFISMFWTKPTYLQ